MVFDTEDDVALAERAGKLGREWVVQVTGTVRERTNKNPNRPTGEIEILARELTVLNKSKVPPFTIEDETDGGDDLRMKYRYLDLRRGPLQQNLLFRSKLALAVRAYLGSKDFVEVETPNLIKSTPEGARDFVVPSRMNEGQFYALPQSPQTFKQLLMVAGYDRYFQIVKCFRDEDLRADRQPEFTQIDCEMAFVTQEEVLNTFEGLTRHLFEEVVGVILDEFPRIQYDEALRRYGSDKPDLRFGMELVDLNEVAKNKGFKIFDEAELVVGICVPGGAELSRRQLDALTDWVKRPQIGAGGLAYVKYNVDGSVKSSIDKFFDHDALMAMGPDLVGAGVEKGDLLLVLSGQDERTRQQMGSLRLHVAGERDMIPAGVFKPLWVVDFPLLEWDEEADRFHAMHHPFTSPQTGGGAAHAHRRSRHHEVTQGRCLRPGHQRGGDRRRLGKDLRPRTAGEKLSTARLYSRRSGRAVRLPDGGLRIRCPTPRRHRLRFRPPVRGDERTELDPRFHCLPEE